ncbi:kinase-like protein [Gonapodya prolifera JEL478]|uniref:Kinase-like protein n=1 Tax=Gonapodya prolifera (strain JEL478) TaxID=1344416 RepID=A0A139ANP0_GONPJ|nr:kinase-like protein [Gonapodya prolifera JEL478]|eukprot:KXS18360.1 kinase-like protein [Gonapodya prolifera JEL478]
MHLTRPPAPRYPFTTPREDRIGEETLSHYNIQGVIATTPHSTVSRAVHLRTSTPVAIKAISKQSLASKDFWWSKKANKWLYKEEAVFRILGVGEEWDEVKGWNPPAYPLPSRSSISTISTYGRRAPRRHPHLPPFLTSISTTRHIHLIFALASTDLFDVVDGNGLSDRAEGSAEQVGVREECAAEVVARLCSVVSWCWKRGVVHRDIKLENILFLAPVPGPSYPSPLASTFLRSLFLSDFGLASLIPAPAPPSKKPSGAELSHTTLSFITPFVPSSSPFPYDTPPPSPTSSEDSSDQPLLRGAVGSPHFAAPEVCSESGYSKMVDSWSIGVVAYLCVGGGYAWPYGDLPKDRLVPDEERLAQGVDFSHASFANASPSFHRFVTSMLHPDPTLRPTPKAALDHEWIRAHVPEDVRWELVGWAEGRDPEDVDVEGEGEAGSVRGSWEENPVRGSWDESGVRRRGRGDGEGVSGEYTRAAVKGRLGPTRHPAVRRAGIALLFVGILVELLVILVEALNLGNGADGTGMNAVWKVVRDGRVVLMSVGLAALTLGAVSVVLSHRTSRRIISVVVNGRGVKHREPRSSEAGEPLLGRLDGEGYGGF